MLSHKIQLQTGCLRKNSPTPPRVDCSLGESAIERPLVAKKCTIFQIPKSGPQCFLCPFFYGVWLCGPLWCQMEDFADLRCLAAKNHNKSILWRLLSWEKRKQDLFLTLFCGENGSCWYLVVPQFSFHPPQIVEISWFFYQSDFAWNQVWGFEKCKSSTEGSRFQKISYLGC